MAMRRKPASIHTSPFDLTDEQWLIVAPLIPQFNEDFDRGIVPTRRFPALGGRPPIPDRPILNGILWKLRASIPWYSLPETYPSFQTCRRRYCAWVQAGAMPRILHALASDLTERGGIDLPSSFDLQSLRIKDRNALFSLLLSPTVQETWQLATLLLFLSPLKENIE
jgi:transposase